MSDNLRTCREDEHKAEIDCEPSSILENTDDGTIKRIKMDTSNTNVERTEIISNSNIQSTSGLNDNETQSHAVLDQTMKVFLNPVILQEIFQHIPTIDLLRFRLVNKLWRSYATTTLRRRRDLSIWFIYDRDCKKYKLSSPTIYMVQDEEGFDYSLKQFINFLRDNPDSRSSSFPCCHFKLIEGSLTHEGVQQFLQLYGEYIRGIALDDIFITTKSYDSDDEDDEEEEEIDEEEEEMEVNLEEGDEDSDNRDIWGDTKRLNLDLKPLRTLLLEQAPNLEYLQMSRNVLVPPCSKLFSHRLIRRGVQPTVGISSTTLPNLKTLKLTDMVPNSSCMNALVEILNAAVNLESVEIEDNDKLDTLVFFNSVNKLPLIKDFHFRFSKDSDSDEEQLAKLRSISTFKDLCLKRMEISVIYNMLPQNLQFLSGILKSCQYSLETLRINNPASFGLIPGLEWPILDLEYQRQEKQEEHKTVLRCMPKLKRLELYFHSDSKDSPEERNNLHLYLSQLFPSLQEVRIEGKASDIFAPSEKLPQVLRLEILRGDNTSSFMERMQQVFPNLQHLAINAVKKLVDFGDVLWRFEELSSLELELYVDGREATQDITNRYPYLDSVFLGFSPNCVEDVIKNRDQGLIISEIVSTKDQLDSQPLTLTDEEIQGIRRKDSNRRSILDCKKLAKLDIIFYDGVNCSIDRESRKFHVFSQLCVHYAFAAMKQVQVTLSVRPNDHPTDPLDEPHTNIPDLYFTNCGRSECYSGPVDYSYDHEAYFEKLQGLLKPLATLPNVKIIEAKHHDLSFLRTR